MVDLEMEEFQRSLDSWEQLTWHRSSRSEAEKYGCEADKPDQNYSSHRRWNSLQEVEFMTTEMKEMEESGAYSPPLWTTSPSRNMEYKTSHGHHGSMSPRSKTRAIIRGQQELMEMVKNIPESKYELTLRDLVESFEAQQKGESKETSFNSEYENSYKIEDGVSTHNKNHKAVSKRNEKIESGGFYIKMAFPTYLRWNKRKKKNSRHSQSMTRNTSSRVSPKPFVSNGMTKGVSSTECFDKSLSASGSRKNDASTVNSGSTKNTGTSSRKSNSRHGFRGYWSCFHKNRSKP